MTRIKSVLLLSGDAGFARGLEAALHRDGWLRVRAADAEEARRTLRQVRPAVVLVDAAAAPASAPPQPRTEPAEVVRRLRQSPYTAGVPVVRLAGGGEGEAAGVGGAEADAVVPRGAPDGGVLGLLEALALAGAPRPPAPA